MPEPLVTPAATGPVTPAATTPTITPDPTVTAQATKAASVASANWRDSLPDDLKADPTLAKYETPEAAHKAHLEAVKLIGKKTEGLVKVPGADATPEERSAYRKAVGVPEKPDDYAVSEPVLAAAHPETLTTFRQMAHEMGLTPAQFDKLVQFDLGRAQRAATLRAEQVDASDAALRKEWGPAFDHRLARVQSFVKELGGEELIRDLELTRKDASLPLLKALDKLATKSSESGWVRGEAVPAITPAQAQARIAELMADKDWHSNFDNPTRHAALVKEYETLIHLRK